MEMVECLSSSTLPERPLALTWEGRRLEIEAILARWRTPETCCFRVRTADGRNFDLSFHQVRTDWQVVPAS